MMYARFLTASIILGSIFSVASAAEKPNIILILADDLGIGDVSTYWKSDISTPHIDSIAANGVRFDQGYVSAPICGPSRAGLLAGKYQQRFGFETNPTPEYKAWDEQLGMPADVPMIQNIMQDAELQTGMVGKWHLGVRPQFHPNRRGFNYFYGFTGGMHSYFQNKKWWWDHGNIIQEQGKPVEKYDYLTHEFTDQACRFIGRNVRGERPFFLYLAYNAPHDPLEAPQEYIDRAAQIEDPTRRTLAAMILALDDGIGRILETLRKYHIEENTLVVFLSDNGPRRNSNGSAGPLNGFKGSIEEGGVRVPFLMQWPAHLKPGTVYPHPVSVFDLMPTFCAAVGHADIPETDGINLLPHLSGKKDTPPHETLYWRMINKSGLRHGSWKLIRRNDAPTALYNLERDPYEKNNMLSTHPEILQMMERHYAQIDDQMIESVIPNPQRSDYVEQTRLFKENIDFEILAPVKRGGFTAK